MKLGVKLGKRDLTFTWDGKDPQMGKATWDRIAEILPDRTKKP